MKPLTDDQRKIITKYIYLASPAAKRLHKKYFHAVSYEDCLSAAYEGLIDYVVRNGDFERIENLNAYFLTIAHYKLIDHLRWWQNIHYKTKKKVEMVGIDCFQDLPDKCKDADTRIMIDIAADNLCPLQREIIQKLADGSSQKEIAADMHKTKQMLSVYTKKAFNNIKPYLEL